MEILKKNKNVLITAVVFALLLWVYVSYFKPDSSTPTDMTAQQAGSDVLSLFASLQSVTLDQSLFSSSLYKNLVDFSTQLPTQPVGRQNPFDTIGRE